MKKYILPYKMYSKSAKALASVLTIPRIKGTKRLNPRAKVINWGSSVLPSKLVGTKIYNHPTAVTKAVNKAVALPTMKAAGVSVVEHTTDKNVVTGWIEGGDIVFARTLASASQGKGIVILDYNSTTIPYAAIYTKYIPKCHEYRVHVWGNNVIHFTKKKRSSAGTTSDLIRNHSNGWIFCRSGVVLPQEVITQSIKAVASLGLDFGAVDILYKERDNKAWVLEVNTAAGIEGTTLNKYAEIIHGL